MKIEVNVSKKGIFVLALIAVFLVGGIAVYAYGTSNPVIFGHTPDEINWSAATGSSTGCPSGFVDGGGYCIETNEHNNKELLDWEHALVSCSNSGAQLCSRDEWTTACSKNIINNRFDGDEWTSSSSFTLSGVYSAVVAMGSQGTSCITTNNINPSGNSFTYRCCKDKGISINVGNGGWKSVSLSNTAPFNTRCQYLVINNQGSGIMYGMPAVQVQPNSIFIGSGGGYSVSSTSKGTISSGGLVMSALYESCPSGITGIGQ
ncbi:MAG: hypothetical protein WCK90_03185 [archaeon]